jgi:hypothetical protein
MSRSRLRFLNTRCSICNVVSSRDIETSVGDYRATGFVADPADSKHYICDECKGHHEELMMEYSLQDDVYGWDEKL